jgi:hypothetical protein
MIYSLDISGGIFACDKNQLESGLLTRRKNIIYICRTLTAVAVRSEMLATGNLTFNLIYIQKILIQSLVGFSILICE